MKTINRLLSAAILLCSFVSLSQNCGTVPLTLLSQYQITATAPLPMTPIFDRLNRPYVYLAAKDGGLLVFDITNVAAPVLAQTVNISTFDSLHVMNAEQHGNYLFLALGNFFGTAVQKPGMAILDVSNPLAPVMTDMWEDTVVTKGSAVVTVSGNYAFLGAMTKGLIILDVSNVNNITYVSEYLPNPFYPLAAPTSSQMPNARGMAVSGNYVYLCYDAGGLRVIDISNINAPFQAGQYINAAALNKQQAYNNIVLSGTTAYIAVDYCGMEVVDVSNIASMTEIGWWNPYHCESLSNLWLNSPGHTNQIAYIPSDNAVFLSAGGSQLRILDVTNPALPDSCNGYGLTGTSNGTWGIDVYNHRIALANITAFIPFSSTWKGLKILDWPSTLSAKEIPSDDEMMISPNPTSDQFRITNYKLQICAIHIYNVIGEKVYSSIVHHLSSINVDVSLLPKGMYFVEINAENGVFRKKMVKE